MAPILLALILPSGSRHKSVKVGILTGRLFNAMFHLAFKFFPKKKIFSSMLFMSLSTSFQVHDVEDERFRQLIVRTLGVNLWGDAKASVTGNPVLYHLNLKYVQMHRMSRNMKFRL
jgi:hypothetical protein